MVTMQREMLCEMAGEVDALLQLHYLELCGHKERKVLAPRWDVYAALEQSGRFMTITARDEGTLLGYAGFLVDYHLHYAAYKHAINDVLFLHPGHRKGATGVRLIRYCEQEAAAEGCVHILWRAKPNTPLFNILSRMRGYAPEETAFGRLLQGN
ncbi:MAG: GNAT family N-acetyltransferase [Pseudomonadota bacterium]